MSQQISREEYKQLSAKQKPSKYRAVPAVVDGIRFASGREAARWLELKLLERAGKISEFERQKRFPLHAPGGIQVTHYVADFVYRDAGDELVIEDVKSAPTRTPIYLLKKKWLAAEYGYYIREM